MSKEIILKSLKLKNFKGIKDLTIDFSKITNIFGENATGKTTIFDSFTWLLFDKDSQDRTSFEIKTLDFNNNVLHGLEHEVAGVLNIDGRDTTLSKTYKEKWTKKRGEAEKELTGHETLYYIDEVPVKKSKYQDKISSIVDEQLFKLISNPLFFSTNMKWQDRRKVLLDIIGDITTERVINYKGGLRGIESLLLDKNIDTLKKSIQARKRKLNDDIKAIPYRIDECNLAIRNDIDFNMQESNKINILSEIQTLDEKILDNSKVSEEMMSKKTEFYNLKSQLRDIEFKAKIDAESPRKQLETELRETEREENKLFSDLDRIQYKIKTNEIQVSAMDLEIKSLREKWGQVNQEELIIPEESFICPTCQRPFEEHDIETKRNEMQENFNLGKAKRLANINNTGKKNKEDMDQVKHELLTLKEQEEYISNKLEEIKKVISDKKEKIANFNPSLDLENNKEYQALNQQMTALETEINAPAVVNNQLQELKQKKSNLQIELEGINNLLAFKEQNIVLEKRKAELMEEEKKLSKQIAELEGQEFLCEEFIKTKVELLESSINNKFKNVSFKLFETQVNGGINECCEALINGVPFSNANTASQINAGLDIINSLCNYYGVQAPIFIDNRESINQILDTGSQVINLIVSQDKNLRVEGI